jgi:ABC-type antimicrobial peptide transport system permease subunit
VIDETVGEELVAMPETASVSGMLQGFAQAENEPFFFVFGYPADSFVLSRFQIVEGAGLNSREIQQARGKPVLIGSAAAEGLEKSIGDTIRITGSVFRIIGIYETGDAFEDSGTLMLLSDAQDLLGKQRQVSLYYIQLKDPDLGNRFIERVERKYPDLSLSGVDEYANEQLLADMLRIYVWVIGGLAIVIGGIGMMNAQLMAVMERTREIGVLRAVGWKSIRVLRLILAETISVSLLGGLIGTILGWLMIAMLSKITIILGISTENVSTDLLIQAFVVVGILGLFGGLYPAWRASRLEPVEALRYEGGSGGKIRRLPIGGMPAQSLWQRIGRTILTMAVIGITVGSIVALEGVIQGFAQQFEEGFIGDDVEIMLRQADIADTSLSAIDERIGAKIDALPQVQSTSGLIFTAVMMPEAGTFFILEGYSPNEFAIRRFRIIEGQPLSNNRQIILGAMMAESLNKSPGDTIELSGTRLRVVGIYESDMGWEEMGGVVTLRDAQNMVGRPRKVSMYAVNLHDPTTATDVVEKINNEFPEVHAALAGDFVEQMPDMQASDGLIGGISIMAIVIGGFGVLNTMLMAVFERTREIGVLRALGWRRFAILWMILRESFLLGLLGGLVGIAVAFGFNFLLNNAPTITGLLEIKWDLTIFARAIIVALVLGLVGGLYPAYRATRLQPIEALRYE